VAALAGVSARTTFPQFARRLAATSVICEPIKRAAVQLLPELTGRTGVGRAGEADLHGGR